MGGKGRTRGGEGRGRKRREGGGGKEQPGKIRKDYFSIEILIILLAR